MPPRTIPPQAIGIRLSAPPAAPASPSSAGLWTSTQDQAASAAPLASVDLPPKCLPLPDSPSMGCSSFPPPPPLMAGDSLQEEYPAPKLGSMTHDIASILPEDFVLHNSLGECLLLIPLDIPPLMGSLEGLISLSILRYLSMWCVLGRSRVPAPCWGEYPPSQGALRGARAKLLASSLFDQLCPGGDRFSSFSLSCSELLFPVRVGG